MQQLMRKPILLALATACIMGSVPAWSMTPATPTAVAATAATSYTGSGTLTDISLAKQTISISGNQYRFTDALRVSSSTGKALTVQDLVPGQSVTYNVTASLSPKRPYIKDIRVLGGPGGER